MLEFHHIGIFVRDLELGLSILSDLYEIQEKSRVYEDAGLGVRVRFLTDSSGICYELVAPFGEASPVTPVLKSRKNILNHIAYRTRHFDTEVSRLRDLGNIPLGVAKNAVAFDGARVMFFLTKLGFVYELIESPSMLETTEQPA